VTVQTLCDQARRGCLAHAASAGKKVGMMKPVVFKRILQRAGEDFLTRYIFKFLGAPLTGDYLIGHESKYEG
jgi:hypothetical protein